jgi:hypothetical protein
MALGRVPALRERGGELAISDLRNGKLVTTLSQVAGFDDAPVADEAQQSRLRRLFPSVAKRWLRGVRGGGARAR